MFQRRDESTEPVVNWVQVVAGGLAAVSTAVLLSTLGVAGTMTGAFVGSVAASVGSAAYARGLILSRDRMAAQAVALRRVERARDQLDRATESGRESNGAEARLQEADRSLGRAEAVLGERRRGLRLDVLPWRRIGVSVAALFVAAMMVITGFELLTGRAVSSYTGGSGRDTRSTVPGLQQVATTPSPTVPTSTDPTTPAESPSPGEPTASTEPTAPEPSTTDPTDGATTDPVEPTPTDGTTEPTEPTEPTAPTGPPPADPTPQADLVP